MKQKQNSTKKEKAGIYLETKPVVDTFKNINKYFLPKPLENSHHAYLRELYTILAKKKGGVSSAHCYFLTGVIFRFTSSSK